MRELSLFIMTSRSFSWIFYMTVSVRLFSKKKKKKKLSFRTILIAFYQICKHFRKLTKILCYLQTRYRTVMTYKINVHILFAKRHILFIHKQNPSVSCVSLLCVPPLVGCFRNIKSNTWYGAFFLLVYFLFFVAVACICSRAKRSRI